MKKIVLLISFVALFVTATFAQTSTTKEVVIVDNFTLPSSANGVYSSVVANIRNRVIAAIVKTDKVEVIDATAEAFFKSTAENASSEAALDSYLSGDFRESASKEFNAKYGLQGHISHIAGVREITDEGDVYYNGQVAMTLKLINLIDGTTVHAEDFNYSGLSGVTGDTDVAAIENTSKRVLSAMPKFISTAFPTYGTIIEIVTEKKGKASEVYIDLGSAVGVLENDKFEVILVKTVGSRTMETVIGTLSVSEVGGEDISTCKVSKCEEQVYQFVKEPGSIVLKIKSVPRKTGFLDAMKDTVGV